MEYIQLNNGNKLITNNYMDKPEYNKKYALTGGTGAKCISNGNSWAESQVSCDQCGNDNDQIIRFTEHKICGKCTKDNHKNS